MQHLNAELAGMQQAQNIKQDAEVQKLKQQLQQLEVGRVGSGFRLILIQRWVMSGLHPNLLSDIRYQVVDWDVRL